MGAQTQYRGLVTYSRNYGRHSEPFNKVAEQLSFMLELTRTLPRHGMQLGITLAADRGEPYGQNIGIMFNLNKKWSFNAKNQ